MATFSKQELVLIISKIIFKYIGGNKKMKKELEKDLIEFKIQEDVLSKDLKIFITNNKINSALQELKRQDKPNPDIIADTIKILEAPFTIKTSDMNNEPMGAAALQALAEPVKVEPVKIKMSDVIDFGQLDVDNMMSAMNDRHMNGGMF